MLLLNFISLFQTFCAFKNVLLSTKFSPFRRLPLSMYPCSLFSVCLSNTIYTLFLNVYKTRPNDIWLAILPTLYNSLTQGRITWQVPSPAIDTRILFSCLTIQSLNGDLDKQYYDKKYLRKACSWVIKQVSHSNLSSVECAKIDILLYNSAC